MKYIIKNLKTGEYLRQGDQFFIWTSDIYYAKVFKGLKGATTVLVNILEKDTIYINYSIKFLLLD